MPTTRKKNTKPTTTQTMGEGVVREIIGQMLREAFGAHSRDLERHLNDINRRLMALEKRP